MNWTLIKETYKESWKFFCIWRAKLNTLADGKGSKDGDIFKLRDLYDFFDGQGIYIRVDFSYTKEGVTWFEYEITLLNPNRDICSMDEPDYEEPYKTKTRTLAEEQAFLKAFEILENKIK